MIALTILGSLFALGVIIMMIAVIRAPRGYEDQDGFHFERADDRETPREREIEYDGLHSGRWGRAHL